MKFLFVGPSLPDASYLVSSGIIVRPPAAQGDVLTAVREGAKFIGLIDGAFEYIPAVWHKEILFGLAQGVEIFGAASMGALRAAECHSYGMIGIGQIFEDYRDGTLIDDSDVALVHAPAELGYFPLTVPLVNVTATLDHASVEAMIEPEEKDVLERSARGIFFKERTWDTIIRKSDALAPERKSEIGTLLSDVQIDQKRGDAKLLVEHLTALATRSRSDRDWTFRTTSFWRENFGLLQE